MGRTKIDVFEKSDVLGNFKNQIIPTSNVLYHRLPGDLMIRQVKTVIVERKIKKI